MEPDRARARQLRLRLVSAVAIVIVFVVGAVVRSSGRSAGTVVLEITAALVIVAVVLLVFTRSLGENSGALVDLRRTEPVSFGCYFENGKRGTVSAVNGDLIIRRFKGSSLIEDSRIPAGTYAISPGRVQLTAARHTDGIIVSDTSTSAGGSIRMALSQDRMTLSGNVLTGPELDRAMSSLQQRRHAAGPDATP